MVWFRSPPAGEVLAADHRLPLEPEDAVLVAAARADRQAFSLLYERYVGPIYRYCAVRLPSREAAEDATSEVFVKALAGLADCDRATFAAWLFRIAHNVVADVHRRHRPTVPLIDATALPDPERTLEETAVARAEQEDLRAALATLPDDQRTTIELQLVGWKDERIAAALGRSPAAVRMLRLRAHRRLRALRTFIGEERHRQGRAGGRHDGG